MRTPTSTLLTLPLQIGFLCSCKSLFCYTPKSQELITRRFIPIKKKKKRQVDTTIIASKETSHVEILVVDVGYLATKEKYNYPGK